MGDVALFCTDEAISALLEKYGKFERFNNIHDTTVLIGPYSLNAVHNGVRLVEDFTLQLIVPADYPNSLPKVSELTGIINPCYEHLYPDGTFCLGVQGELLIAQLDNPSLSAFLDGPVCSFLYSYLFHEHYGRYPFGDRAHGAIGILQYYEELFGETDLVRTIMLLWAVCFGKYRGHLPCPCGSGLATRKCHGEILLKLKNSGAMSAFTFDFETIVSELEGRQALIQQRREALRTGLKAPNGHMMG